MYVTQNQRSWRGCLSLALLAAAVSCTHLAPESKNPTPTEAPTATKEVVLVSEVVWEQLNPARGDQSPRAGTLWGDRKGIVPTGYLIKFEDGFSSPPHIHNVSYRGVVISGLVHNDDPEAARMWMPTGSFWTQPKGEVHITAAKGADNLAYIEIEQGPYLVWPTVRAFDSGERPVNVDASNLVWLDASVLRNGASHPKAANPDGVQVSFLWGSPSTDQFRGAFVKLPAGFAGKLASHGSIFKAIVTQGRLRYGSDETSKILEPGSYIGSDGATSHQLSSDDGTDTVLYIRTNGRFEVLVEERPSSSS